MIQELIGMSQKFIAKHGATILITVMSGVSITVVSYLIIRIMKRQRQRVHERRVVRYLERHTENRAGKQYLPIEEVATEVRLDVAEVADVVDRSPRIFRRERDHNMVGLYRDEESMYNDKDNELFVIPGR